MNTWSNELMMKYFEATGDTLSHFSVPYDDEHIKLVKEAIRTGKPLPEKKLPKGAVS